jgi:hypothetical protein
MFSFLLRHVSVPRISDVMFHAQPAIDMTDSSTALTKANAQCRNRLAVSLETATRLARSKRKNALRIRGSKVHLWYD